ncbi:uncharacterized protein LY89DRAFT_688501 [Mollisia scopiformis]|uniref:Uncharacterized protein n=1 Tax=Mollisia scopiformis TaxID=149040 RepID=A0A194WVP1_MOLSC|nr:uncharacterized protein LY89DRAFT_688501 [Mollisia scopiformis]KUJ12030.1 hypothetical protein LY89DRAFT_688501 [Mollisia scopiformis]
MYASSTFVFTAILALAKIAVATPPACLIAAIGAQANPGDLKSLCGSLESQVVGNITEKCSGSAESAAISVYSATCLASASVTISIPSSSSTSAFATGTGKTSATGKASGSTTATTGSATAKVTGTGSSSTGTATGTAASSTTTKASSAGFNSPQLVLAFLAVGFTGQYLL